MLSTLRLVALATIALAAVGCDRSLCEEHVQWNAKTEDQWVARTMIEVKIKERLEPIIGLARILHGPTPTMKCPLCDKMVRQMAPEIEREQAQWRARFYAE